ncbi:MAG TPA: NAD-dependent malic enzyme [Candidatus Xenobia bacterium]|jgi:malate dehydrogenase (oxaloacetate-decarboxylating)
MKTPTVSYSITVRARLKNQLGMFARLATAIADVGGSLGAIDLVEAARDHMVRDISISAGDEPQAHKIVQAIRKVDGVQVISWSDRTFQMHLGGKIEVTSKLPLRTRDDLSMAYTPGVGRVCTAIHEDPNKVFQLTVKRHMVAVVTDGSAVLGLGNLGPEAALPVMEGKSILFKTFGGVDAFPICLATQSVDEIVRTVELIAPVFGGINLEDIAAPRCFEVEDRLRQTLNIPVFHDDQHGTAVVALAGLMNALKVVGKTFDQVKVVIVGAGAAGIAIAGMLQLSGVTELILCDRQGAIYYGREEDMNPRKQRIAETTNPQRLRGTPGEVLTGADIFLGVSAPGVVSVADIEKMAHDPIVFAMANPDPEISPEDVVGKVRVMATGRSDYPNQINNVLCFPGLFRGVLDCRARTINDEMKMAASQAIAGCVSDRELAEEYIIPSVFNKKVAEAVARAVEKAAVKTGVARRERASWRG